MNKALQVIDKSLVKEFDNIVTTCSKATANVAKSLAHDMMILNGIKGLKQIFAKPEIKTLILDAAGNEAGFLCDKPSYNYDQLVGALIPRLLEGYRMTGNEINIIAGKGMAVKRGKYRRIIELTSSFRETIGTPQIKDNFALIKCAAKWKMGDEIQSIGIDADDPCILKIKYNADKYDTIDKVLGLAQSKLYSRVLTRLTGQFIAEEPSSTLTDVTPKIESLKDVTPAPVLKAKAKAPKDLKDQPKEESYVEQLQKIDNDQHMQPTLADIFADETFPITQAKIDKTILDNDEVRAKNFVDMINRFVG